jgi:mono/diheme cytochrome c family protein
MTLRCGLTIAAALLAGNVAQAADADNGRRIAMSRCAACHTVEQGYREVLAFSPPFELISAKFQADPDNLVRFILAPHAKMNMTISPREAADVAAYIRTLAP